jgi:hypothetical protein
MMRNSEIALYSTIAAVSIFCLLFLPRTSAFIAKATTRSNGSAKGMTRLPNGMPIMPEDAVKYTQVPKVGSVFTVSIDFVFSVVLIFNPTQYYLF